MPPSRKYNTQEERNEARRRTWRESKARSRAQAQVHTQSNTGNQNPLASTQNLPISDSNIQPTNRAFIEFSHFTLSL